VAAILDHFVWGTDDPAADNVWFNDVLGAQFTEGGSHDGQGTKNSLLGLNSNQSYLEMIYPDPQQLANGCTPVIIPPFSSGGIFHWAARHSDLEEIKSRAEAVGLITSGALPVSRQTSDGDTLEWQLLFIMDHRFGGAMPFYIDWGNCPHPSNTLNEQVTLDRFSLLSPHAKELQTLLEALDTPVDIDYAEQTALQVELSNGGGAIKLPISNPVGEGFKLYTPTD